MNDQQTEFKRIIGTGYLFLKAVHADAKTKAEKKLDEGQQPKVAVWEGHLTFPGQRSSVQVMATASSRTKEYAIQLRQFPQGESDPDAWKVLAEFSMPILGGNAYTEGVVPLDGRKWTVRLFKTGQGYLRLRLPQVMSAAAVEQAAM